MSEPATRPAGPSPYDASLQAPAAPVERVRLEDRAAHLRDLLAHVERARLEGDGDVPQLIAEGADYTATWSDGYTHADSDAVARAARLLYGFPAEVGEPTPCAERPPGHDWRTCPGPLCLTAALPAPVLAALKTPPVGFEARCGACGETFNPADETDLEHLRKADGTPCGGAGRMVGAWS